MENGVMMQYFEWNLPNDGQLWNRLAADAQHLHDAGVTAVWIPPAYKADEQQDEGYATYDLYDLGEFDQKGTVRTKYGTRAELAAMVAELHRHGISVYLDTVLNHKLAGDFSERFMAEEVDPDDRHKALAEPREIQAWTGYNFPGRGGAYSAFQWHWYHFSGVEWDDIRRQSGIFRIVGENKYWNDEVDTEKGNYDYLLGNDLDLDHPEVIAELNRWGQWVAKELDLDGMRLDALKHIKSGFIRQFLEEIRQARGKEFFAVGEYWNGSLETLDAYLESVGNNLSLFDVPLHYNMYQASVEGEKYDMRKLLDQSLATNRPTLAVTFVDNHDSQRGSSLESQVKDWFKPLAYALILLMEDGYPCLFYGDYYGMGGKPSPHRPVIDLLLDARRRYAYGEMTLYFDHPATVGFVRAGDDTHPHSGLALLLTDGKEGAKRMNVGARRAGETWHDLTGNRPEPITIDAGGYGDFTVSAASLSVWVQKDECRS